MEAADLAAGGRTETMTTPWRPRCYSCGEKRVRPGSRFCSNRCAAMWAEELAAGNDDAWCDGCQEWTSVVARGDGRDHCAKCDLITYRPETEDE